MATFKIQSPNRDYTGTVGNVAFAKGDATVDDEKNPAELAYFRNAGYVVEEVLPPEPEPEAEVGDDDNDPTMPPPGNASADAWRAHVLTLPGVTEDQVKDLSRDQLRELAAKIQEGPKA
jgi:hypothetical protein